jgi:hypothetical protein
VNPLYMQDSTPLDLASHTRLYNYFIKSGAAENKILSFIDNINSSNLPPEKVVELVYQLYEISKLESISLDQVSSYIREKLEEKQKIDDQIEEAMMYFKIRSRRRNYKWICEVKWKTESVYLSFQDIDKLLNVLVNVKEYGFDGKKIVGKLKRYDGYKTKKRDWNTIVKYFQNR